MYFPGLRLPFFTSPRISRLPSDPNPSGLRSKEAHGSYSANRLTLFVAAHLRKFLMGTTKPMTQEGSSLLSAPRTRNRSWCKVSASGCRGHEPQHFLEAAALTRRAVIQDRFQAHSSLQVDLQIPASPRRRFVLLRKVPRTP